MMEPIDHELATVFKGKVTFIEVDIGKVSGLGNKYGVRGVPTYKLFKDGKEVGTSVGYKSKDAQKSFIQKAFGI